MPLPKQPTPDADCSSRTNVTLQVLKEYAVAATLLQNAASVGNGPWRFMILHSTELCLNAFLQFHGHDTDCIRKLQHSFGKRLELAKRHQLVLKKKTIDYLHGVDSRNEYVKSRYEPLAPLQLSEADCLINAVQEVAGKVAKLMEARGNVIVSSKPPEQPSRATSRRKLSA